jgi:hypothetical protein
VATKSKRLTAQVDEGIRKSEREKPFNPFITACRHITKPRRIPVDDNISDAKTGASSKFAFISFGKFNTSDFTNDFIPLCGQCRKKVGIETCYQHFLNRSPQEEWSCHRGLDIEACERRLLRRNAVPRATSWQQYQRALSEALDVSGANIVVVNELGIPAPPTGPSRDFFRQAKSWARKTSSLIITGSFHDARTKYNTGYIFTPASPNCGYAFHKQVSAKDIKEHISIPANRQSVMVRAFGFNIVVIICLDLLDYSTVASLVDMRDAVDFILVPSYSESEGMVSLGRVAKIASEAMPGGVGIVNCHDGKTHPNTMHVFGDLLAPAIDRQLADGSGWLSIYEIDWQQFNTGKKNRQEIQADIDWLLRFPLISTA